MSGAGSCALVQLPAGASARVVQVPPGPLQVRLTSLGLVVGASIELRQATPVVLVKVGATTLALEARLGAQILVRRENGG